MCSLGKEFVEARGWHPWDREPARGWPGSTRSLGWWV